MSTRWIAVVGCVLVVFVGCSTSSGCDSEDDGVEEGPASADVDEESEPQKPLAIDDPVIDEPDGADDEALRWMRAGPGAVVVKLHLDALDEQVAPVLEPVVDEVGPPMGTEWVEQFLHHGPLMAFEPAVVEHDAVEALDGERAAYISRQPIAWDSSYFETLVYGAVIQSDRVGPAGTHYRMLLPADDPQKVAEALDGDVEAVLTAGDHYLRVDVVGPFVGGPDASVVHEHFELEPEQRVEQLIERAASRSDDTALRETPALATFLDSTAPAGVYFRSEDLRVMQATNAIIEALDALEMAAPEYRQEMMARGVAGAMNALAFTPRSEFEYEDTVLELRAPGVEGLVVDAASTQSEHGRTIAAHMGTKERLADVPAIEEPMVEMQWDFDVTTAAAENKPLPHNDESQFADDVMELMPPLAEYYRDGGIVSYLSTLFITPSYVPRLLASLDVSIPRLSHIAFDAGEQDGEVASIQFGGVGIFDAEEVEQRPPSYVAGLKAQLESEGVEVALTSSTDEASRLDMVAGEMVGSEHRDEVVFDAATLSATIDSSQFGGEMWGDNQLFEALGTWTRINAEWSVDGGMTRQRYAFGDVELERPELAEVDGFEPQAIGADCTRSLVGEAIDVFMELEQIAPGTPVDEMVETLLSDYDQLAEECASNEPHLADHLDEVRAGMRFILFFRTPVDADGPEGLSALYEAICDAGDATMCPPNR